MPKKKTKRRKTRHHIWVLAVISLLLSSIALAIAGTIIAYVIDPEASAQTIAHSKRGFKMPTASMSPTAPPAAKPSTATPAPTPKATATASSSPAPTVPPMSASSSSSEAENATAPASPVSTPTPAPTPAPTPVASPGIAPTSVSAEADEPTEELPPPEVMTPAFKFIDTKTKFKETVDIKGQVEGALSVELYVTKKGSISPSYYLSQMRKKDAVWSAKYDSTQLPNGEYSLYAQIKNAYGEYKSDSMAIRVDNKIEQSSAPSTSSGGNPTPTPIPTPTPSPSPTPPGGRGISATGSSPAPSSSGSPQPTPAPTPTPAPPTPQPTPEPTPVPPEIIEQGIEQTTVQIEEVQQGPIPEPEKTVRIEQLVDEREEHISQITTHEEAVKVSEKFDAKLTKKEKDKLENIKQRYPEDTDGDGLPDSEERRIGTFPQAADSDGDGYLDGDEIRGGYDPLKWSPGDKRDKILYEEPKKKGAVNPSFKINEVRYTKPVEKKPGIKIAGHALPHSFITVYVYSETHIVLTVKTDASGNWQYILDKNLEDGKHEIYVAVTDNTGKITSKSQPYAFVKTAQAISKVDDSAERGTLTDSPFQASQLNMIIFFVIMSLLSFVLAITSIALFVKHYRTAKIIS